MSDENTPTDRGGLRSLVANLERRRSKIARVKGSFEVLIGAYDLVAADLRAAYGERDTTTVPPDVQGDCAAAAAS
jgi:hypothetical protein